MSERPDWKHTNSDMESHTDSLKSVGDITEGEEMADNEKTPPVITETGKETLRSSNRTRKLNPNLDTDSVKGEKLHSLLERRKSLKSGITRRMNDTRPPMRSPDNLVMVKIKAGEIETALEEFKTVQGQCQDLAEGPEDKNRIRQYGEDIESEIRNFLTLIDTWVQSLPEEEPRLGERASHHGTRSRSSHSSWSSSQAKAAAKAAAMKANNLDEMQELELQELRLLQRRSA